MSTLEHFAYAWRVVVLVLGAFDIGIVAYIVWAYLTGMLEPAGPYRKTWHVVSIATSYMLLAGALWVIIASRALAGEPVRWYLAVATVAYPLGLVALERIARHTHLVHRQSKEGS